MLGTAVEFVEYTGYGPPGLLDKVRTSRWETCTPGVKGLRSVFLAGMGLTIPGDRFRRVKYEVTVGENGSELVLKGWCYRHVVQAVKDVRDGKDSSAWSHDPVMMLNGVALTLRPNELGATRYDIRVKPIFD